MNRRAALLAVCLTAPLVQGGWGSAWAAGAPAPRDEIGAGGLTCVQGYARSFLSLNTKATELKLKAESAPAEVDASFKVRPARCEVGGYDYFLEQFMRFARRAMHSGATTPKEGWVKAAAAVARYAPAQVPQVEYSQDMDHYRAARTELVGIVTEVGAGPLPSALLYASERVAPVPGPYGPVSIPAAAGTPPPPYAPPAVSAPPSYVPPAVSAPPSYAPGPSPAATAQTVRVIVPGVPLPDWGVAGLFEIHELIQQKREGLAVQRLDQILRWVEAQR